MAKKLQLRGGTTSDHGSFTGAVREVTVDTDLKTLRVHDGSTAGGIQLARLTDVTGATSVGTLASLTVSGDVTVDTSTLKVDSSNNRVGIGTTSPNNQLDISNTSGNAGMNLSSANTGTSFINFADTDDPDRGQISYVHTDDSFRIKVEDTEKFRMKGSGDFHADGDVVAYSTTVSDVALKTDIEMIPNALDKIDEVRGVTFTRHNGQKSAGIIAQELEKVLPEAVREKELDLIDGKTYKTVEYDAIHGLLINCIKELKEEIKELKNGITK